MQVIVLREVKRCLKEDGVFCLSTNSARNKPEMHRFHDKLVKELGISKINSTAGSERFPAEDAIKKIQPFFKYTFEIPYMGYFNFTSSNEFLDYYRSTVYFKKLIIEGYKEERMLESSQRLLEKDPILKLSNDGTIALGTDSVKIAGMIEAYL